MPQFNSNKNASLGNIAGAAVVSVTDDVTFNEQIPAIPAAQPGVLTVRTNNTSGSLTMTNAGHGIITGQRIDLYWTGGQCYGAIAGTVAGTVVPIASVSGGSVLPAAATAINVGIPQQRTLAITGNNLSALLLASAVAGYVVFSSVAPADLLAVYLTAGIAYDWFTGNGVTNPLAAVTVATVWVSHGTTTGTQTMGVGALYH